MKLDTNEIMSAYADFLSKFERMFYDDWSSKTQQEIANWSEPGGFLNPGISEAEESNNWNCRGALLASYRKLKATLGEPLPWEDPRRPENYHLRVSNGEIS